MQASTRRRDTELNKRSFGNSHPSARVPARLAVLPSAEGPATPPPRGGARDRRVREQSRRKLLPGTAAPTGAAPTAGHAQRLAAEPRASARGGKARKRGKLSPRHTPRRHSPRRSEPVCGHARAAAGAAEEEAGAGGAGEPTGARRGAVSHHGRAGRPGSWYKSAAGTPSPRACLRRPPFLVAFLTAASARPPSPPLLPPSLRPLGAAMRSSRQRGDRSAVAGGGCGARRWALPRCGALCLLLALGCLLTATDGECGAGARTAGVLPPLPAIASSLSPLSVVFVGFFFFCVCAPCLVGVCFFFCAGGIGAPRRGGEARGASGLCLPSPLSAARHRFHGRTEHAWGAAGGPEPAAGSPLPAPERLCRERRGAAAAAGGLAMPGGEGGSPRWAARSAAPGRPTVPEGLSNYSATSAWWHPAALAWLLRASCNHHGGSPPGGEVEPYRAEALAKRAVTGSSEGGCCRCRCGYLCSNGT